MQTMLNHRDGGTPSYCPPVASPRAAQYQPPYEPVLFLPGLLCDHALWRSQINALSDRCAPFVADLTLDDSITAMARRTLAAAPPSFSLVALSMGGYVALEIMRLAPERVRRLALIDTSARTDTPERTRERLAGIESLRRGAFLGVSRPLLRTLIHRSHWDDEVAATMRAMAARVGKAAFLRQQRAIMDRPDGRPHLHRITVPTLIAVGREDRITPTDHAHELHDAIDGSALHIVDRCGHMAALEEPDHINDLLGNWLA